MLARPCAVECLSHTAKGIIKVKIFISSEFNKSKLKICRIGVQFEHKNISKRGVFRGKKK